MFPNRNAYSPLVQAMAEGQEVVWRNPACTCAQEAFSRQKLTAADTDDAAARLARFAPFFMEAFPETAVSGGLIESPLTEIPAMRSWLNSRMDASLSGRLFLKRDSDLAVAGSVKARGGIYEVLKHSEELALEAGLLTTQQDYRAFLQPELRSFLGKHAIHVGSTGNLGLSIGIMSAALGYQVYVHMSADARQWKKDLLRQKGVHVVEYAGDYGKAVASGRALAAQDPAAYFVDDENSVTLFLGYAVAARRLKAQLAQQNIPVDAAHPLFVYIPCGVGGAPGGICYGLRQEFGDFVHVYFVEPTMSPCMLLGLETGLHEMICVQDIGLSGKTAADGLAVGRPSGFVGKTVQELLEGCFTVSDDRLLPYLKALWQQEQLFIEPSACAGFQGPVRLHAVSDADCPGASHIVWATGGRLVPEEERAVYLA